MKKATITLTIISILISAITFYVIKLTDKKNIEIEQETALLSNITTQNENIANSIESSDENFEYYHTEFDLDEKQYIKVNECMQFYIKDRSFINANNCQKNIVDQILNQIGEKGYIKSIMGDMLSYSTKNEVFLKTDYITNIVGLNTKGSNLKDHLILSFVNRYRDPEQLQAIYNNNKMYFFDYIPKSIYDKVYKNYINTFVNSYDDIHNQSNKENFYKEIYFKAEKQNKQSDYWHYTFWKRRELEKNDKIIYTILKEIDTHYTHLE